MPNKKVLVIKSIHLALFIFMCVCLFYILYCAITGTYDWTLLAAMAFILIDALSIVFNRGRCPFTTLAEKYGAENGAVTHLILPAWAARHVFKFFIALFVVEIIWLGTGYFT